MPIGYHSLRKHNRVSGKQIHDHETDHTDLKTNLLIRRTGDCKVLAYTLRLTCFVLRSLFPIGPFVTILDRNRSWNQVNESIGMIWV